MTRTIERTVKLLRIVVIGALIIAVVRRLRGSGHREVTGSARWHPLGEATPPPARTGPVKFTDVTPNSDYEPAGMADRTTTAVQSWVEPVDGACPASHPIKGNADSGIFHIPGGTSYERTKPERCYVSAADAEADGFRQAKR